MAKHKIPIRPAPRPQRQTAARAGAHSPPPTVSARWLLTALGLSVTGAALCTWAVFCLLFWQGSWQLLYHPTSTVARTPANIGLAFDAVSFATSGTGISQIQGWWIPAPTARYTALYLHDQAGNLGDTLDTLAGLHASGLNLLAFDYRGYGQSRFEHPSEARWRQDADWALDYLTGTRHIDPHSIVIVGAGLGANLALEVAAAHPELAGVVLDSPLDSPVNAIFHDGRATFVPARLLVRDRYDLIAPASALRIPSLWLTQKPEMAHGAAHDTVDNAFARITAAKTLAERPRDRSDAEIIGKWLTDLK